MTTAPKRTTLPPQTHRPVPATGPWPDGNDYRDALQHPDKVFSDTQLRGCRTKVDHMGLPKPSSGQFAIVYRLKGGTTTTAVRVFRYPQPERAERYQTVHEYLSRHGRPRCILDSRYEPRGIRINGLWYPVQTMEWVAGVSLEVWLRDMAERQDRRAIGRMAEQWAELMAELRAARIAHGDLQHGNILVVGERPVLVDYDCMCVPALVGRDALEEGKPAYQHPDRAGQALSLELDHFSAWVILIALRAIAADFNLWARYVKATGNENLLFCEDDMRQPEGSALWKDLLASKDSEVKMWARRLRDALAGPFDRIPPFEVDPFRALEDACRAAVKDWDLIHRLACQPHLTARTFPPNLAKARDEARRRTAARDRLQKAVDAGSLRAVAAAYDRELMAGWLPCATLAARGQLAAALLESLNALETARAADDVEQLIALWKQHGAPLINFAEGAALKVEAERWTARAVAYDNFRTAITRPGATDRAVADAWRRLVAEGGHPRAESDRPRAELAVRRVELLDRLRAAAEDETEDNDRAFASLWNDDVLAGCAEIAALWPRLEAVRCRLEALEGVRQAAARADRGEAEEAAVVAAAAPPQLPPGYPHHLATRIAQARVRVALTEKFLQLVQRDDSTERAIADAWDRLLDAGGSPAAVAAHQARAELARERVDALDCLRTLAEQESEDADRRFAEAWPETVLKDCAEAAPLRPRLQRVRERLRLLEQLQTVVDRTDRGQASEEDVVSAAAPLPKGYAYRLATRVDKARKRLVLRKQLEQALARKAPSDRAIAAAWEAAKGVLRFDKAVIERCELAVRRRDCLAQLEAIDKKLPLDEQDARWLAGWSAELLDDCADAAALRARWQKAVDRTATWEALEEVLRARDLERVGALAANPLLADYPPARRRWREVEELLRQAEQVERVVELLRTGGTFTEADLDFVRDNPALFAPRRGAIEGALATWLAEEVRLHPSDPPWDVNRKTEVIKVRFAWPCPHFGRVFYCRIATSERRFFKKPADAAGTSVAYAKMHSQARGTVVAWERSWRKVYVTVWPVVELGWAGEIVGPPLEVGPIVPPAC